MSEPVRTNRDRTSPPPPAGPATSFLRRLAGQLLDSKESTDDVPRAAATPGLRFDDAHAPSTGRSAADSAIRPSHNLAAPADPAREAVETRTAQAPRFSRSEEEVLRQTGQIAAHLRNDREELERRESALHEQHALLDQEWRSARLWVQEFEEDMAKRQAEQKAREAELNEKITACESMVSDLEEQERLVLGLRDQMSTEKASLKSVVDRELQSERLSIRQTQEALEAERRALADEIEKRRREREEMVRSLQAQLQRERATLRNQLETELTAERAAFEAERATWSREKAAAEAELAQRLEVTESASQRAQEELLSTRRREFDELRHEREALEAQVRADRQVLDAERASLDAERRRFGEELAELKRSQVEEIERERACVREEIESSRRELDTVRSRIEDDLKQRVEERERSLRDEQQKLDEQHREQLGRLERERNLLENRVRFQQEHLQKARQEVEAAQNELRRQHQADRTDLEEREQAWRLRCEQMDHVRALIEEREQSIVRENALWSDYRQTRDAELKSREQELTRQREEWTRTCQEREADLERRETTVASESERLEKRRERLEGLRTELEETHRKTLEMRMAIEDVWAQLSEATGAESAQRRLAETQRRLEDDSQQTLEAVAREKKELALLQSSLQAQRLQMTRETQEASEGAQVRLVEIERQLHTLAENASALRAREEQLNTLRHEWVSEKIEVERIIRGLLIQLGQQTGDAPDQGDVSQAA